MKINYKLAVLLFLGLLLPTPIFAAGPIFNFPINLEQNKTTNLPLSTDTITSISSLDLGNDGTSELVIGAPTGFTPQVNIIRQDGSAIVSWFPYGEKFTGGVAAVALNTSNIKKMEIVTAPLDSGGPHIKFFNSFGKLLNPGWFAPKDVSTIINLEKIDFDNDGWDELLLIAYDKKNILTRYILKTNGTLLASEPEKNSIDKNIDLKISQQGQIFDATIPRQVRANDYNGKIIIVNLSQQKLSYFQDGFRIATNQVSTGRWGFATPIGEFAVQNKTPRAYSKAYGLYMPYWMAFYRGQYGLHELPEWPNGYKEGANHLGIPVSHGCVRLGVGAAKKLYDWAEVGTKIIVQK